MVPIVGDLRPLLVEAVRGKLPKARIVVTASELVEVSCRIKHVVRPFGRGERI
jgi:hypothetical protein